MTTYIGVVIGAISILWIYPLSTEMYGLAQFLIPVAGFILPFATLGITTLVVRYFPDFNETDTRQHGFLGFLLFSLLFSFSAFTLLAVVFKSYFIRLVGSIGFDEKVFSENFYFIIVLCFFMMLNTLMYTYAQNFKRIVIPDLISNLVKKMGLPVLILLYVYQYIDRQDFKILLVSLYAIIQLGLSFYLWHIRRHEISLRPDLSFLRENSPLFKSMRAYSLFSILSSVGSVLAFRIDNIMVTSLQGLASNGVYSIAMFVGNTIAIPSSSVNKISGPIVAQAWKTGNMSKIDSIYQKSSLLLLIAGCLMFFNIWLSVDDIFRLTPRYEELIIGKYVVFFLGIAKIIDMVTAINHQIIAYSKFYKFNLLAILILAVLNIGTNMILIPKYHIVGAAIATAISISLFNIMKFVFIYIKFSFQPFKISTLWVLLISLAAYVITWLLPLHFHPLLNIVIRSVLFSTLFMLPILYFNISPDVNRLATQLFSKIKRI